MAKQRYINTKIWEDAWFSSLDQIEQLVFIYFLTNPMTNIIGAYELSKGTIGRAVGLETLMLDEILKRFEKADKVHYVRGWVIIKNFIKHQNFKSPKIKTGILAELEDVPEDIKNLIQIPYTYGIDTLSHINSNIIKLNTNTNSEIQGEGLNSLKVVVSEKIPFQDFWGIYPNKTQKKKAEEKWNRLKVEVQDLILKDLPERIKGEKWQKDGGKYVEMPTTYLNGERWNDEIKKSNSDSIEIKQ